VTTQEHGVRPHAFELRSPWNAAEWDRYHAIRKTCLFETYHPWIEYDRHHPDERDPANHPLGFLIDGEMVGSIRIDEKPDRRAVFRMVAIANGLRGRHLGSRLLDMAEGYAADMGASSICLNSVAAAVGFYRRRGYDAYRWQGCTSCPTSVPLTKRLKAAVCSIRYGVPDVRSSLVGTQVGTALPTRVSIAA
jgi:ribosomal protein S18 acetylase RimI-like enzyme